MPMQPNKLGLGTVQFGMNYGVANLSGQIELSDAYEILEFAKKSGIETLDTAIAYGESEQVLGSLGVDGLKTITKLPKLPIDCSDVAKWVECQLDQSLEKIKKKRVYGLLLHNSSQLLDVDGLKLYMALNELKAKQKVEKIGVSIYSTNELDNIIDVFKLDLVQAPVNIFDRSLELTGLGKRLKEKGIEIHARSIFLQGLLLIDPEMRPKKFSKWKSDFEVFNQWLTAHEKSALEVSLKYVEQLDFVDKLIVGVDNKNHLEQVVNALGSDDLNIPVFFKNKDQRLINPSLWSEL